MTATSIGSWPVRSIFANVDNQVYKKLLSLTHRDTQDTHYRVELDHNVHGAHDFWPSSNQYPEKGMVNELYGGITENKR